MTPEQLKKAEKLANLLDAGNEKDIEILDTLINIEEKIKPVDLSEVVQAIKDIPQMEMPEHKEFPTSIEVSNFPEYPQFPEFPEQKAPIVNVQAPIVNVKPPQVTIDNSGVESEIAKITALLEKPEEQEETKIIDEDGKVVDFKKLFHNLSERIANIRVGGGSSLTVPQNLSVTNLGMNVLSGADVNGTRDLTSANTWYTVPSTVPTQPYMLVATIENNAGTVRWGFDNTGTPSATNGNLAPGELKVRLDANKVIYYASSTAGDDINWTTIVI